MEYLQSLSCSNSLADYIILSPLGRGAASFVYRVQNRTSGCEYALKVIDKKQPNYNKFKEKILQEIRIHKSLNHINIVQLIDNFQDSDNQYLLLELCDGGEISNLIKQNEKLNDYEIRKYGCQILNALQYLQQNEIIHRDLKLSNIVISNQNIIKIADFGLAIKIQEMKQQINSNQLCGTPNYLAPEILKNESYSPKSDIWAYGCILYALATGSPPFDGKSMIEIVSCIKQSQNLVIPDYVSKDLKDLICKCLERNMEQRINCYQAMNHPFFKQKVNQIIPKQNVLKDQQNVIFNPSFHPFDDQFFLQKKQNESWDISSQVQNDTPSFAYFLGNTKYNKTENNFFQKNNITMKDQIKNSIKDDRKNQTLAQSLQADKQFQEQCLNDSFYLQQNKFDNHSLSPIHKQNQLKSTRFQTQNDGFIEINNDKSISIEAKNLTFIISSDSKIVQIKKNQTSKSFQLNKLPLKYKGLYLYAKKVCQILLLKTPLIQVQNNLGKFKLLQNNEFQATLFENQHHIQIQNNTITYTNQKGDKISKQNLNKQQQEQIQKSLEIMNQLQEQLKLKK